MCYPSWHKKARRHTLLTTTMAGRPPTSPWWIHFEKVDGTHPWFAYFPNDNLKKAFIRVAKQHLTPPPSSTNVERLFSYGSDSSGRGKWSKCGIFFFKLCCDQTVRFFQLFSTVLKRFCPLDAKNVSVLVLAFFFDWAIFTVFTPNWRFLALFEVGIEPSCN